jgi:hypothetical protein
MSPTRTKRPSARTLTTSFLSLGMSLLLIAAMKPPAAAAGLGIEVDPIGSGLQFHASSPFAVDWEIQVSLGSIVSSPFPPHFPTGSTLPPRIHRFTSNGTAQTSFAPALSSLLPNSTYNYIVRGGTTFATGSIRTFLNRVTILYDRIDVIDDSDSLSAGDLTFHFSAGAGFDRSFGEVQAPSGAPVLLPSGRGQIQEVLFNKSGTLKLAVEAVDDDHDPPFEACRSGQPPDGTSGSDNCFDWATATFETNVAQFAGAGQNSTTKAVTFQTTGDLPIRFKVFATIKVEYGSKFPTFTFETTE